MFFQEEIQTLVNNNEGININGNNNVASGRDTNLYLSISKKEEQDWGIIEEIYNHIIASNKEFNSKEDVELSEDFVCLQEKIQINFQSDQIRRIEEMVMNVWTQKTLSEKFLKQKYQSSPMEVLSLLELVQSEYCRVKNVSATNSAIESISIIEELAKNFVPEKQKTNPLYLSNAKALVLHFFEFCDIGKKTSKEKDRKQ